MFDNYIVTSLQRRHPRPTHPPVTDIMRYEAGEMTDDETVDLFQALVDSGLAWKLQGHYGRTATYLINAGYVDQRS